MTVDGLFLTDKVNRIYQEQRIHPVPFMTGLNSDEGGWLLPSVSPPPPRALIGPTAHPAWAAGWAVLWVQQLCYVACFVCCLEATLLDDPSL